MPLPDSSDRMVADGEGKSAEVVIQYLQSKRPEMHEALGIGLGFNTQNLNYELTKEHHVFLKTLKAVAEGGITDFNPAESSWKVVLDKLGVAQAAAAQSERSDENRYKKQWRRFSRMSTMLVPALEALPESLNMLHGGLALVFHLAYHAESNRRAILDAFQDLPEIIAMAHSKSVHFPDNEGLREVIEGLQATLLQTIPNLVDILRPGSFRERAKSAFRSYDIDQLMDQVRRSSNRVEAYAEHLHDSTVIQTYLGVQEVRRLTATTQEQVGSIKEVVDREFSGLNTQYEGLHRELTQGNQFLYRQVVDAMSSQQNLFQFLKDTLSKYLHERESVQAAARPRSPDHNELTCRQLMAMLNILRVPDGQEDYDLASILQQSRRFEAKALSQASIVLQTEQFRRWISHDAGSDLLLVEGHLDSSSFGKTSPLSHFCASITQLFREASPTTMLPLHFFCSQHVAANDELKGPSGLIRSLLAQLARAILLHSHRLCDLADLSGLATLSGGTDPEPLRMATDGLCHDFLELVRQLPPRMTVVVILDDIARFERAEWLAEYWELITIMNTVISDRMVAAQVKVLMTCPTKSKCLALGAAHKVELSGSGQWMGASTERALWSNVSAGFRV